MVLREARELIRMYKALLDADTRCSAPEAARGIDTPRIWTAERDIEMWEALQG